MFGASRQRCTSIAGVVLFVVLALEGLAEAASTVVVARDPVVLLQEADNAKASHHLKFTELLKEIDEKTLILSSEQRLYLRYLKAWELTYESNDDRAIPLLDAIAAESKDKNLQFRASATVINILANLSRFEEAFTRLNKILVQLPHVTNSNILAQGLADAAILYEGAGQYELELSYADRLLELNALDPGYLCKGEYYESAALYRSGALTGIEKKFTDGISDCESAGDNLFANAIRSQMADFYIKKGHFDEAVNLLQNNYQTVEKVGYVSLISRFDASLAQAYWGQGNTKFATRFAEAAVASTTKNIYTDSLAAAYEVLYQVKRKSGDLAAALAYHIKYMAADKGYLNEVSAKALAFQVVNQQLFGKTLQIETLNKQNQILELQHSLGAKASETSRLYIILLLTVVGFIALWAWRIKRSQLTYMKLARRDGLTGIYNRQHFVASAERSLRYCQKSGRVAGVIVIDLDNFKNVNDVHGHAVGDDILKRTVAACEAHLRSTDVFGRLGGEEFGILMPECDSSVVAVRAELIRTAIASVSNTEEATGVVVSASFGISSSTYSGYDLRQLLIHADKALYGAKHNGRNRVVAFSEVDVLSSKPASVRPLIRR